MCNVVGRNHDGNGPGIYTPYKIITNMCGDDVLYASGNYGDHEFSGMLNEFRYDAEAEVPKFMYTGLYSRYIPVISLLIISKKQLILQSRNAA